MALDVGPAAGARVVIPAGALGADTVITAQAVDDVPPPEGLAYTAVGPAVRFGPSGTLFVSPVTVTLPYSAALLGAEADRLAVLHRNDLTSEVALLIPSSSDGTTVSAETSSFSTFQAVRWSDSAVLSLTATPEEILWEGTTSLRWSTVNTTACVLGFQYCLDNPGTCPFFMDVPTNSQGYAFMPESIQWGGALETLPMKLRCQGRAGPVSSVVSVYNRPRTGLTASYNVPGQGGMMYTSSGRIPPGTTLQLYGGCSNQFGQSFPITWSLPGVSPGPTAPFQSVTFNTVGDFTVSFSCMNTTGRTATQSLEVHVVAPSILPNGAACNPTDAFGLCNSAAGYACLNNVCASHCQDGVEDYGEVGLDCGGVCSSCGTLIGDRFQDHPDGYVNLSDDFCGATKHRVFARMDLPGTMTLGAARAACEALPPIRAGSWHLPTDTEWAGNNPTQAVLGNRILPTGPGGVMNFDVPATPFTSLPGIQNGTYWGDSEYYTGQYMAVNFTTGRGEIHSASDLLRVRCVARSEPPSVCN